MMDIEYIASEIINYEDGTFKVNNVNRIKTVEDATDKINEMKKNLNATDKRINFVSYQVLRKCGDKKEICVYDIYKVVKGKLKYVY